MIVVNRIVEHGEAAHQDRTHVDLGELGTIEDSGMLGLFNIWRDLRMSARRLLPSYHDMRWQKVVDVGMQHRVNVINVSSEVPAAYRIEMQALLSYRRSGVNLIGLHLGDHSDPLHAEGLQRDFHAVKERGQPRYYHIRNRVDGRWRSYRRLILPFAGPDGRTVETLMIGVRLAPLPQPDPVPLG